MIGNLVSYGRKPANFNRPSLRITPSSSIQGLSVINWLFFGIGFPALRAAYSSWKVSRCALFPLQHPLFLRATVPYLHSCCLCCACCVVLFSLSRILEPNASNWNTVSDQVSILLVCCSVSVYFLSEGYTS